MRSIHAGHIPVSETLQYMYSCQPVLIVESLLMQNVINLFGVDKSVKFRTVICFNVKNEIMIGCVV